MEFTIQEAQAQLPQLLAHAAAGEEVVITDGDENKPVAKVVACPQKRPIRLGLLKGIIPDLNPGDPFFDPLPEEELRLWNGEED